MAHGSDAHFTLGRRVNIFFHSRKNVRAKQLKKKHMPRSATLKFRRVALKGAGPWHCRCCCCSDRSLIEWQRMASGRWPQLPPELKRHHEAPPPRARTCLVDMSSYRKSGANKGRPVAGLAYAQISYHWLVVMGPILPETIEISEQIVVHRRKIKRSRL